MLDECWENITEKRGKITDKKYQTNSKKPILFLKSHTLFFNDNHAEENVQTYLTFATFDSELIILLNQNPFGLFNKQYLGFVEKLKVRTKFPIQDCILQTKKVELENKYYAFGYFIDIFSNLYYVNLNTVFEYNQRISINQPVKPTVLYLNTIPTLNNMHLSRPMLFHKFQKLITTIDHSGLLRVFDLTQQKSWVQDCTLTPKMQQFKIEVIAADSCRNKSQQNVFFVVFNNNHPPYPFVNSKHIIKDFLNTNQNYNTFRDRVDEIIDCKYDPQTKKIVASLISSQIQVFKIGMKQVETSGKKNTVKWCESIFRARIMTIPSDGILTETHVIETIDANKGFAIVLTSREYMIFSLEDYKVKKRYGGKRGRQQNVSIQKLRWALILEKDKKEIFTYLIAKGFNHHNSDQSKNTKPHLHFKELDFSKIKM